MKDSYERRNKIAALVANNYAELARAAYDGNPDKSKTVALDVRAVFGTYLPIIAALGGETDPHKLGIDPMSMTALQIATLTSDPTEEPAPL